jgi:hypothetical protein
MIRVLELRGTRRPIEGLDLFTIDHRYERQRLATDRAFLKIFIVGGNK